MERGITSDYYFNDSILIRLGVRHGECRDPGSCLYRGEITMTDIEKRLDESAWDHTVDAFPYNAGGDQHLYEVNLQNARDSFKYGTRYGIEWVIEMFRKCGANHPERPECDDWADLIQEHFSLILNTHKQTQKDDSVSDNERGRE